MRQYKDDGIARAIKEMDEAFANYNACRADGRNAHAEMWELELVGMARVFSYLTGYTVNRGNNRVEIVSKNGMTITGKWVKEV